MSWAGARGSADGAGLRRSWRSRQHECTRISHCSDMLASPRRSGRCSCADAVHFAGAEIAVRARAPVSASASCDALGRTGSYTPSQKGKCKMATRRMLDANS
eukprot:5118976-Pleurochrysis_carterae.AAC.3